MFAAIEGDGPWAARAIVRAEEDFRAAGRYEEALGAALRFIETWRDDPRGSAVLAGAIESLGEKKRTKGSTRRRERVKTAPPPAEPAVVPSPQPAARSRPTP